ncbi:MAG: hypothetical protein EBS84_20110 [Proteobacteria bacterium]|nr:hypothetical protein [Pseudomonadota bacterium]
MKQPYNPPAFPWNGQMTWVPEKGMTLRDYFAAKALQGGLAARATNAGNAALFAAECYAGLHRVG